MHKIKSMQSLSGEKKTNYQQPGGYNQQRRTAQNNVEPIPVVFVPRADYSTRPAVCCHSVGQMLTMCLQHHQGCLETPKCAYVIYGQHLTAPPPVIITKLPFPAPSPRTSSVLCRGPAPSLSRHDSRQSLDPGHHCRTYSYLFVLIWILRLM